MTKVVVTEEMVRRFCDYIHGNEGCEYKYALEAALNPQPEPEIEVTDEMFKAGEDEYRMWFAGSGNKHTALWSVVYRAMRRLAPDFNKGPVEPKASESPMPMYKTPSTYRAYTHDWTSGLKND